MDEEYDNDYAGNYFDNGEGDDMDDLGDGGGGDGGGVYALVTYVSCVLIALRRRLRLIRTTRSRSKRTQLTFWLNKGLNSILTLDQHHITTCSAQFFRSCLSSYILHLL